MSTMSENKIRWIAITGLIGSGKSTVIQILKDLGYPVISCDALVHEMYEDSQVIQDIQNILEENVLTEDKKLDRNKMAKIMFHDQTKKRQVEAYVYPRLRDLLYNRKKENKQLSFVEVPLLFECGWESDYDEVWLVISDEKVARKRLKENRNMSDEQINQRLAHQIPSEKKIEKSDIIIDNSTTLESLEKQIKEVLYEK